MSLNAQRNFDPITFLVARKYPGLNGNEVEKREQRRIEQQAAMEKVRQANAVNIHARQIPPSPPSDANQHPEISVAEKLHFQRETDAAAYRAELVKYSPEQLSKLVQCERAKENAELIARIQSEENARFFNLPNAKADFGHYCKAAVWALDEAIALSFGKEPRIVNWKSVSPWVHVSAFARNYERRRDLCVRALRVGQLFDPVYPSVFLAWAKDKKIDLSTELSSAAVDHSISFQGWKDLYENLDGRYKSETNTLMQKYRTDTSELVENYKRDVGALTEQLLAARSELAKLQVAGDVEIQASPPLVEDRPLKTRERESLQLIAVICAIPAFSFDPDKRNDASRRIASDLENLGLNLSEDAIRNHLKAASEMLPGNWRERLRR